MRTINKVMICGRIGQAPNIRQVGNQSVANFSIATSRSFKQGDDWKEETQWHNVAVWGAGADKAAQFAKGDFVLAEGEIRYRKYTDKDGVEKSVTDIHAFSVQLMEKYKPQGYVPGAPTNTQNNAMPPMVDPFAGGNDPFAAAPSGDIPF